MIKNNQYIKEFKVNTSVLSKNELEVFNKLIEASKLISIIYSAQLDSKGKTVFYPEDAKKSEIEQAAEKNGQIHSPYTVVERDFNGNLITTPYHIKYRELLEPVVSKIKEAARLSTSKEFAHALEVQADCLLKGDYKKAEIMWRKTKPYVLHFVIGPNERLEDELFYVKRSYEAWVGISDKNMTNRFLTLRDTVFTAKKHTAHIDDVVEFMDKADMRVDEVAIFTGFAARYQFSTSTLPNDIDVIEKYGTEATVFLQPSHILFKDKHHAIFNTIFEKNFKKSFTEEDLHRGHVTLVEMHEISRVLIRYKNAAIRLKELYPIFNELATETNAVKSCGSLMLKDAISQKEMEAILVMFITRIFDYYFESPKDSATNAYVQGNAIMLNSLVDSGALKIGKDGISWPNFTKMFIAASSLADEMEKILAEGSYENAEHYLKEHSSLEVFKQFSLPHRLYKKV